MHISILNIWFLACIDIQLVHVSLMEVLRIKDVLKSIMMVLGELCVMMDGIQTMQMLPAGSWGIQVVFLSAVVIILGKVGEQCGWRQSNVRE